MSAAGLDIFAIARTVALIAGKVMTTEVVEKVKAMVIDSDPHSKYRQMEISGNSVTKYLIPPRDGIDRHFVHRVDGGKRNVFYRALAGTPGLFG